MKDQNPEAREYAAGFLGFGWFGVGRRELRRLSVVFRDMHQNVVGDGPDPRSLVHFVKVFGIKHSRNGTLWSRLIGPMCVRVCP